MWLLLLLLAGGICVVQSRCCIIIVGPFYRLAFCQSSSRIRLRGDERAQGRIEGDMRREEIVVRIGEVDFGVRNGV